MPTMVSLFSVLAASALAAWVAGCGSGAGERDGGPRGGDSRLNARTDFERSQDPPFKAETHFAAARLAESQGDAKRAVEQYRACLKIDPKHKDALYRLGVVLASLQHHPEAIIAFKRYVEATGGDALAFSDLGFCYELSGQPDQAEQVYQKGVAKDPQCHPCRVNYGLMLARAGRVAEATIQLQAALRPAEVHYNLASVYEMQGRRESARVEYQKALEADPDFSDALVRMSALK